MKLPALFYENMTLIQLELSLVGSNLSTLTEEVMKKL